MASSKDIGGIIEIVKPKLFHRPNAYLFEENDDSPSFYKSFRPQHMPPLLNGGMEQETGYNFQLGDIIVHQPSWKEWKFYIIRRWTKKCMDCRLIEKRAFSQGNNLYWCPITNYKQNFSCFGNRKLFKFSKIKEDRDSPHIGVGILQRFHKYRWVYPRHLTLSPKHKHKYGGGPEWAICDGGGEY